MPYVHVDRLGVYAWGKFVGAIAASPRARGAWAFQYTPKWREGRAQLAPLLMPHSAGRGRDTFVFPTSEYNEVTYRGLPPMLADSLPDAFGNNLIDAELRGRGLSGDASSITPLDRLAYIGARTMGALTFRPADERPAHYTSIDLKALVEEARAAVRGDLDTERHRNAALTELLQVGTSAGGARPKAVVAWNRETNELRAGNIEIDEPGFEQWLLKFDGVDKGAVSMGDPAGYTRIERAYSLMAGAAGITVPETALLTENGRAHFMSRRFDRTDTGERLHLQSLCGIAGLDFNLLPQPGTGAGNRYEDYFETMQRLGITDDESKQEAFRRMVFNVLAANNDDHTKNFAFLMNSSGRWSLAPAYDLTFSYDQNNQWLRQHLMSVNGKRDHIAASDLWEVADAYGIPNVADTIERVAVAIRRWPHFADAAGVSNEHNARVSARLKEVSNDAGIALTGA